jgi:predicted regulator of Ras-like GTPase activity (Roadblock/LC7/MglB family)
MENHLKEINAVLGVVGSFVGLPDSSIAAQAMPAAFDATRVEFAARVAAQTLNALETSGQRVAEVDLVYSQGRLLLKNLRGGILVIMCARAINVPLLNMTANVAAKRIAAELRPPKAPLPVSTPPVSAETVRVPLAPVSSATQTSTPAAAADRPVPSPESVDHNFFVDLTRELNRIIGPAGSIVIEEEVDALKEQPGNFPKARAAELVERVSTAIRDETKRAHFKQGMLEAVRKL